VADQITAPRKGLATKCTYSVQMTKNWIPDVDRGRGEVWFVEGALQKSTSGQDDVSRAGA
jgi:hypothetical protein